MHSSPVARRSRETADAGRAYPALKYAIRTLASRTRRATRLAAYGGNQLGSAGFPRSDRSGRRAERARGAAWHRRRPRGPCREPDRLFSRRQQEALPGSSGLSVSSLDVEFWPLLISSRSKGSPLRKPTSRRPTSATIAPND